MAFTSLVFLFGFLPIVLLLYYGVPFRLKNAVLALAGLLFYAWGSPLGAVPLVLFILADWTAGLLMERAASRPRLGRLALLCAAALNVGGFFLFRHVLPWTGLSGGRLTAVGISVYTLLSLSYLLGLFQGRFPARRNLVDLAAYIAMFPLMMGPVPFYSDIREALSRRALSIEQVSDGIASFVCGLSKLLLLACPMGALWRTVAAGEFQNLPAATAWIGVSALGFSILFELSGCADMALGLGGMLGFSFPRNFRCPFLATSVRSFCRRFNTTLGGWFRSFVYLPLGGSREGRLHTARNLAFVWLLVGLWYGTGVNCLLWGLFFCVAVLMEKYLYGGLLEKLPGFFRWFYSALLVTLSWVWFGTGSPAGAGRYFAALFGANGAGFLNGQTIYLLCSNLLPFFVCILIASGLPAKAISFLLKRAPGVLSFGKVIASIAGLILCVCYAAGTEGVLLLYGRL